MLISKTSVSEGYTFFAAGDAVPPQLNTNVSKILKPLFAAKTTTFIGMIGLNLSTALTLMCLYHDTAIVMLQVKLCKTKKLL